MDRIQITKDLIKTSSEIKPLVKKTLDHLQSVADALEKNKDNAFTLRQLNEQISTLKKCSEELSRTNDNLKFTLNTLDTNKKTKNSFQISKIIATDKTDKGQKINLTDRLIKVGRMAAAHVMHPIKVANAKSQIKTERDRIKGLFDESKKANETCINDNIHAICNAKDFLKQVIRFELAEQLDASQAKKEDEMKELDNELELEENDSAEDDEDSLDANQQNLDETVPLRSFNSVDLGTPEPREEEKLKEDATPEIEQEQVSSHTMKRG